MEESLNKKLSRWLTPVWGSILSILIGLVLVIWPEFVLKSIIMIIGIFCFAVGIFALGAYFINGRHRGNEKDPTVIVTGVVSILFGILLLIMPKIFAGIIMYLLGALLILAGIQQIVALVIGSKNRSVSFMFYILPVLIIIAGIVVILNPFTIQYAVIILLGAAEILYGIVGLINKYKLSK